MTEEPGKPGSGETGPEAFDEYLSGGSPVSERYAALGDENPPAELDARILAEAERAAKVRTLPLAKTPKRWMGPIALAATLVVSFSLVMNLVMEAEGPALERSNSSEPVKGRMAATEKEINLPVERSAALKQERFVGEERVGEERADEQRVGEPKASRLAGMAANAPARLEMESADLATSNELAPMVAIVRDFLSEGLPDRERDQAIASAEEAVEAQSPAAYPPMTVMSRSQNKPVSPDALLAEILRLYDEDQAEATGASIVEFRRIYPEHPVSVLLLESGY